MMTEPVLPSLTGSLMTASLLSVSPLPILLTDLSHVIDELANLVLFLDIDGTLSEFHPDPQQSTISNQNLVLLAALQTYLPVWLVTGRSVDDARRLTAPLALPIIGSHGLACDDLVKAYSLVEFDLVELAQIQAEVIKATISNPQWLVETKPHSVTLHFRQYPELAEDAEHIMRTIHAQFDHWQLKAGKFVWELLPHGVDKGKAIKHILDNDYPAHQYPNCRPIFIGDDVTDEAGFVTVQAYVNSTGKTGIGIKVGDMTDIDASPTHARYYVNDVTAVTALLQGLLTLCQN